MVYIYISQKPLYRTNAISISIFPRSTCNLLKCINPLLKLGKKELKIFDTKLKFDPTLKEFCGTTVAQMKNCIFMFLLGIYLSVQNCRLIFDNSIGWATRAVWKRLVFGFFTGSIMGIQIPKITKSQKSGKRHHIPDIKNIRWRLIVMLCWQVQLL